MIHIERSGEPELLRNKKAIWLQRFLASGRDRPNNSQYAHNDIKHELFAISHNKCYYCERQLKDIKEEVDHHIEVSIDPNLSFEWANLFLSCDNCNNKINHLDIPVTSVLDPFINTDEEIEHDITFIKEEIKINNGSPRGELTIKKFKLSSKQLDFIRSKFLLTFYDTYCAIIERCNVEGRGLNDIEKENLLKYSYKDHPFSLMFKVLLRKKGLL